MSFMVRGRLVAAGRLTLSPGSGVSWGVTCVRTLPVALALALAGCAHPSALDARIDDLLSRARTNEPGVTARLQSLAETHGAALIKLEYRLKTRSSMTRKLRKMAREQPGKDPSQLALNDALRYTFSVDDAPTGHYLATVTSVLTALEADRHQVVHIKNYWPRGDSYSGLNCVLSAADGSLWELQFHTPASIAVQAATRSQYEELRLLSTPVETKRRLFDEMTRAWGEVPVPAGLVAEDSIHPRSKKKILPRP